MTPTIIQPPPTLHSADTLLHLRRTPTESEQLAAAYVARVGTIPAAPRRPSGVYRIEVKR